MEALLAVLGLKSPGTEGKELTLKLFDFCLVFHSHFQDLQPVLGDAIGNNLLFALLLRQPCGSLWWSGYQMGNNRGKVETEERWRDISLDLRLPYISHWSFGWVCPPGCHLVMICALGDHITLQSFPGS